MKEITTLKKAFPNYVFSDLNDGMGANVFTDAGCITLWFKKRKVGIRGKWYVYKNIDEAIGKIQYAIKKDERLTNQEEEDLASLVADMNKQRHDIAKEQLDEYVDYKSKQGTQQCIDHITRKIATVEKNNPNNAVLTVLKALEKEFEQYL